MATRKSLYLTSAGYAEVSISTDVLAGAGMTAGVTGASYIDMTFQMFSSGAPDPRHVNFTTSGGGATALWLDGAQIALADLADGAGVVSTPVPDDTKIYWGTDSDGWVQYNEALANDLRIETKGITGGDSSGITVKSGDTAASGNSGDVQIGAGTAAGTRGKVKFTSDVDSQSNNVVCSSGTLDVPAGTSFKIGTTSLTTVNWTAANLDDLLDGTAADSLHKHVATFLTGQTTGAFGTAGEIGYISGSATWGLAQCDGTLAEATCEGAYIASGVMRTDRAMSIYFVAALGAVNPGDPVYVSATAGQATNVIPVTAGQYVSHIGTVLTTTYGSDRKAVVMFRPATPVLLS